MKKTGTILLYMYKTSILVDGRLVYISSKYDSLKIRKIVESHLSEFGIDYKSEIVATTTDGARHEKIWA